MHKINHTHLKLVIWGFTCLFVACGEIANSETEAPSMIPVSEFAEVPEGIEPPKDDLKVALVWNPPAGNNQPSTSGSGLCPAAGSITNYNSGFVAQDVNFEPVFPARVKLDGIDPPPKEVLLSREVDLFGHRINHGSLVLYRDGNHNGKLDKSSIGQIAKDEILGDSQLGNSWIGDREKGEWFIIAYSEVSINEPPSGNAPEGVNLDAGYTIYRIDIWDFGCSHGEYVKTSLDTEIPIAISSHPKLQTIICEEVCEIENDSFVCPDSISELPEGDFSSIIRYSPGTPETTIQSITLIWRGYTCDKCICLTSRCEFTLEQGQPIPADWPCPERLAESLEK